MGISPFNVSLLHMCVPNMSLPGKGFPEYEPNYGHTRRGISSMCTANVRESLTMDSPNMDLSSMYRSPHYVCPMYRTPPEDPLPIWVSQVKDHSTIINQIDKKFLHYGSISIQFIHKKNRYRNYKQLARTKQKK